MQTAHTLDLEDVIRQARGQAHAMQAAMEQHHPSDPLVNAAEALTATLDRLGDQFHSIPLPLHRKPEGEARPHDQDKPKVGPMETDEAAFYRGESIIQVVIGALREANGDGDLAVHIMALESALRELNAGVVW